MSDDVSKGDGGVVSQMIDSPVAKLIEKCGVVGLLGLLLYQVFVVGPDVFHETQAIFEKTLMLQTTHFTEQLKTQADSFTRSMEGISAANIERSQSQERTVTAAILAFREDEREDRRLFVEILKRSDLTPAELEEAVERAIDEERPVILPPPG